MSTTTTLANPILEHLSQAAQSEDPFTRAARRKLRSVCEQIVDPKHENSVVLAKLDDKFNEHRGVKGLGLTCQTLSLAGHLVDELYFDHAKTLLLKTIDQRLSWRFAGSGQGKPYQDWLHAFTASSYLIRTAYAYLMMEHRFNEVEEEKVKAYYQEYLKYYVNIIPLKDERWPACNRTCYIRICMSLLAEICLSKGWASDIDLYERLAEEGKFRSKLFLKFGHEKGCLSEGPSYGTVSLNMITSYAWFRKLWHGDDELSRDENWGLLAEGIARQLVPGQPEVLPFNDSEPYFGPCLWLWVTANQRRDSLAFFAWRRLAGWLEERSPAENFDALNDSGIDLTWLFSLGEVPSFLNAIPKNGVKHYEEAGMVLCKSGWGDRDTFFSFMNDKRSAYGRHVHADRNHFNLYALGETFIMDSGYTRDKLPYANEELRIGGLGEAHNLPTFFGCMQRAKGSDPGGIRAFEQRGDRIFIEGEAGHSYDNIERFTRRALYCRTQDVDDPGFVVIVDHMGFEKTPENSNMWISWLLHTHKDNRIEMDSESFEIIGGRHGNRLEVHMSASFLGRWREDRFHDHPRMHYEWFSPSPAYCICVLAPKAKGGHAPKVEMGRHEHGSSATVEIGSERFIVLAGKGESKLEIKECSTQKEFAFWHERGGEVVDHIEA